MSRPRASASLSGVLLVALCAAAGAQEASTSPAAATPGPVDAAAGEASAPAADAREGGVDAAFAGDATAPAGAGAEADAAAMRARAAAGGGELRLETTAVTGNRELPRVMVIVPWKNAEPVDIGGRPLSSLVEEALTPIDREVFRRELDYYGLLHGDAGAEAEKLSQSDTESQ